MGTYMKGEAPRKVSPVLNTTDTGRDRTARRMIASHEESTVLSSFCRRSKYRYHPPDPSTIFARTDKRWLWNLV